MELDKLDDILKNLNKTVIVSPDGIVFASNFDNLYNVIYPIDSVKKEKIIESKQFADNKLIDNYWKFNKNKLAINNESFYFIEQPFEISDWKIIIYDDSGKSGKLSLYQKLIAFGIFFIISFFTAIVYFSLLTKKRLSLTEKSMDESIRAIKEHEENIKK